VAVGVKLGIALARLHPAYHEAAAVEADRLGFESVWMSEHLVFPIGMSGSPHPGEGAPPVPPTTPVYDAFAYLAFLAAKTSRVRLGTNVYLLGLRHPFVAARAVATLDVLSGGRAEVGIGAGWLREEWSAAGLDPRTRGRRLDEALAVCKRLWSEPVVGHRGEFFEFPPVAFEPKPVQKPWPPVHVGGESEAALRRAARSADGWYGLAHDWDSARARVSRLVELRRAAGRERERFEVTLGAGSPTPDELKRFEDTGVDRLVIAPWSRSRDAVEGLRRCAELLLHGAAEHRDPRQPG
jgi:probable F420-dependent oxidoreductase